MPSVFVSVAGQHARPDDATGREAGIVDAERLGVAHHLQSEVATGHEPAVENGDPRERTKLRQDRMRIGLELLEGDVGGGHLGRLHRPRDLTDSYAGRRLPPPRLVRLS